MGNSAILSSLSNYKLSTMMRLLSSLLLLLVLVVNIQAAPSPGLDRRMAESDDDFLGHNDKNWDWNDQKNAKIVSTKWKEMINDVIIEIRNNQRSLIDLNSAKFNIIDLDNYKNSL